MLGEKTSFVKVRDENNGRADRYQASIEYLEFQDKVIVNRPGPAVPTTSVIGHWPHEE